MGGNFEPISVSGNLIGVIANRLVDAHFESQINDAQRRIEDSVDTVRRLVGEQAAGELIRARLHYDGMMHELAAARADVRSVLRSQREAYDHLAEVAARVGAPAGVGAPGARDRVAAVIAAVPLAEVVVSRNAALVGVIEAGAMIPYSPESGSGFAMAQRATPTQAADFLRCLSLARGLRDRFATMREFWVLRVASLRGVLTRLGGLEGGADSR